MNISCEQQIYPVVTARCYV